MLLNLTGEISQDTINLLMEALNQFEHNNLGKDDRLHIYFDSEGGDVNSMYVLIDIINRNKFIIELTGTGSLYSAAFLIFFSVKCVRKLLPGTIGMCHFIRTNIEVNGTKGYYTQDKVHQQWNKYQNQWIVRFCQQIGMTASEIARVKKTEEVYLHHSRLQELLDSSK